MEEKIIEATSRDGSISAKGITLYAGSERKLLIGCAGLLFEHELLVRTDSVKAPFPVTGRSVLSGKVAELLLDLSEFDGDATVQASFATNLGSLNFVLEVRTLAFGTTNSSTRQAYPLSQG